MSIIKIACLGLTSVMLALFLRQVRPEYAGMISLAACLLIIGCSMTKLSSVFAVINEMSVGLSGEKTYIRILLKIIGITYVTDFSSAICKDAGFSAIAGQIVMFGKIAILAISSPIILTLLETVYGFL